MCDGDKDQRSDVYNLMRIFTSAVNIHNIVGVDVNSATLWCKPFDAINNKSFRSPYDRAALFDAHDF